MRNSYSVRSISLGKNDPDSIMHYPTEGSQPSQRTGQRECLSDGDLKVIKYLYLGPCCTYEVFEEEYFVQNYYECITCWGSGSAYGVCEHCKLNCHRGHEVIKHDASELASEGGGFVCDCGRNRHILNLCTRITTKEKRVEQIFYTCSDCFQEKEYKEEKGGTPVVCKACSGRCHAGHRVTYFGVNAGFCDCGRSYCKTICKANK
jgi:hypothetical protein